MRRLLSFPVSGTPNWQALQGFSTVLARRCGQGREWLIGVGELDALTVNRPGNGFEHLRSFLEHRRDWVFAQLGYGLGAEVEPGLVWKTDASGWPKLHAFVPRFMVQWRSTDVHVQVMDGEEAEAERLIGALSTPMEVTGNARPIGWSWPDRQRYLQQAANLMGHIQRGDIYEVNYCVERSSRVQGLDPYAAFAAMDLRLQAPHAGFYKVGHRFALCQSPERFIQLTGRTILSEPMKGTRPRHSDPATDRDLAAELAKDPKERSENIMAVDVLRHDLSRIAAPGSVAVPELCMVKSLPAVHQMTSTVTAELRPGLHPVEAIRSAFPMASMTGAPKASAMQLINDAEEGPRGLYSGALGFFSPDGDADFNVVIRTVLFDERTGHLSLTTGSALTAACNPEQEWEECGLKARSVIDALDHAG